MAAELTVTMKITAILMLFITTQSFPKPTPESIDGEILYPPTFIEIIPESSCLIVRLLDISLKDVPAVVIASKVYRQPSKHTTKKYSIQISDQLLSSSKQYAVDAVVNLGCCSQPSAVVIKQDDYKSEGKILTTEMVQNAVHGVIRGPSLTLQRAEGTSLPAPDPVQSNCNSDGFITDCDANYGSVPTVGCASPACAPQNCLSSECVPPTPPLEVLPSPSIQSEISGISATFPARFLSRLNINPTSVHGILKTDVP